ncbi:hypothetical protein PUN28_007360 [Cardiocondyla obscurior]|uniref:Uncharacterized protein n=1 Tax=Cardiocondyla obscurior TaxID=286306 RepID=A0AAW2G4L7_9HYME
MTHASDVKALNFQRGERRFLFFREGARSPLYSVSEEKQPFFPEGLLSPAYFAGLVAGWQRDSFEVVSSPMSRRGCCDEFICIHTRHRIACTRARHSFARSFLASGGSLVAQGCATNGSRVAAARGAPGL